MLRIEALENQLAAAARDEPHERLRKKAAAQREGKRRRAAAREAAHGPKTHGRGKRSKREPFVSDETIEREVVAEELPVDAAPNGFVVRHFYGLRLRRHNVSIRLREYISPTEGRIVAKLPRGWAGEFTPETWVNVSRMSAAGLTEPRIQELFSDSGVKISAGQINHMLLTTADWLLEEQKAAHRAGMEHSKAIGMDGTHSTLNGEPVVCHIVGNEVFTTMSTTPHKDRVTVISVLAGEPVAHCVGEQALKHSGLNAKGQEVLLRAIDEKAGTASPELIELSTGLRGAGLNAAQMERFLELEMPKAGAGALRQVREATAMQWLRKVLARLPTVMLTDGGTN